MVIENCTHSGTYLRQVQTGQDKGLQTDNQVFVWRKNIVVGELYLTVEVLAAAFGVELNDFLRQSWLCFLVVMMVSQTMYTFSGGIAKTAHDMMVFGAIMELHIPSDRHEQHRKGHQKGTDLQQPLFHGCKSREKGVMVSFFSLISRFGTMV